MTEKKTCLKKKCIEWWSRSVAGAKTYKVLHSRVVQELELNFVICSRAFVEPELRFSEVSEVDAEISGNNLILVP